MRKTLCAVVFAVLFASSAFAAFVPGTYEGIGTGFTNNLKVKVTVDSEKITDVEIDAPDEIPFGVKQFKNYSKQLIGKSEAKIDAASGATMTRDGVVEAVNKALEAAKKQKEDLI